jgi:hypothetical protein
VVHKQVYYCELLRRFSPDILSLHGPLSILTNTNDCGMQSQQE